MALHCVIIDDSPSVAKSIIAALDTMTDFGDINVVAAETPQEGLRKCEEHMPDVVFLDILLGDENITGDELVNEILESNPHSKVVIISGLPENSENIVKAMSNGAFAYMKKPVRKKEISKVIFEIEMEDSNLEVIK